jgi:muconolactone delta-isomerase
MALFHVRILFDSPSVPNDDRSEILARERERGIELCRAGALQRIWRVSGTSSSISIWEGSSEGAVRERALHGKLGLDGRHRVRARRRQRCRRARFCQREY